MSDFCCRVARLDKNKSSNLYRSTEREKMNFFFFLSLMYPRILVSTVLSKTFSVISSKAGQCKNNSISHIIIVLSNYNLYKIKKKKKHLHLISKSSRHRVEFILCGFMVPMDFFLVLHSVVIGLQNWTGNVRSIAIISVLPLITSLSLCPTITSC